MQTATTNYDTATERYSHLSGLTDNEIKLVMFTADVICDVVSIGRKKRRKPRELFFGDDSPPPIYPGERYLLERQERAKRRKRKRTGRTKTSRTRTGKKD